MASLIRISIRTKVSSQALRSSRSSLTAHNNKNTTSTYCSRRYFGNTISGTKKDSNLFFATHAGIRRPMSSPPLPVLAGGSSWCCVSAFSTTNITRCESAIIGGHAEDASSDLAHVYQRALAAHRDLDSMSQSQFQRATSYLRRALRMALRAVKLMCTLTPVVAFYPLQRLLQKNPPDTSTIDAHTLALSDQYETPVGGPLGLYLKLCLVCVEYSGAAVIKLMQWAGSRPDMFGHDFCSVFSRLQDDTTPHAWRHTEKVLREAYGDEWRERITIRKDDILGSGCIGQVYKGEVLLDKDGTRKQVAVKVMHPSVEANIDADLDLMRFFVRAIQKLPGDAFSNLKWLNMEGAVEDFADMLKLQLDCRVEAKNLERFNENFAESEHVVFPKLVEGFVPSKDVLIETFCEGVPVLKFAKEHKDEQELLSEMCVVAIEAVCKMIFLDNFMHGDLHPGNVLIDPVNKKFVLLDVGIVAAYTEEDHTTMVDVLTSFIRRQGRKAGRLMIDSSNRLLRESNDQAIGEERFIDKMEEINIEATTKGYLMENLGYYITFICNAAAKHHVMLNQAFISAALAVKIQEGIALALDPSVKIYKVATPTLYESERRRGKVKNTALKILGLDDTWIGQLFPAED